MSVQNHFAMLKNTVFHYKVLKNGEIQEMTMTGDEVYKKINKSVHQAPFSKGIENDEAFDRFQKWLLENGAEFPHIEMCSMGESLRGCYMKDDVSRGTRIVKIPSKLFMSCDMGIDIDTSEGLKGTKLSFDDCKHLYLCNFLLEDMEKGDSFFQPYYDTLPKDITNIPILWSNQELNYFQGSYFPAIMYDRIADIHADYRRMCDVNPMFFRFPFDQYLHMRLMIGSRNFGSQYRGYSNGLLVPLADMLNHVRPRQTTWEYNESEDAFTITALIPLKKGDQVFDSYGRKDNRRLFFCYGFVEDDNVDGNGCSPNTVAIAILPRHANSLKGKQTLRECIQCDLRYTPFSEEVDCDFFYNSLILDIVENDMTMMDKTEERSQVEQSELKCLEGVEVDGTFGSLVHERTAFLCKNSQIFTANIALFNDHSCYDHSQSKYAFLSMCHDDAGKENPSFYLRVLLATEKEYKSIHDMFTASTSKSDIFQLLRGAISISNELNVLRTLAMISRVRLAAYKDDYMTNMEVLRGEEMQMFSNERNAVVMLRSEQQIFLHYIMLYQVICDLCKLPACEQREIIMNTLDDQNPVYDYLMSVWMTLLAQCEMDEPVEIPTFVEHQENMAKFLVLLNSKGVVDPMRFL